MLYIHRVILTPMPYYLVNTDGVKTSTDFRDLRKAKAVQRKLDGFGVLRHIRHVKRDGTVEVVE